jgi:polar amino acid transport system substrate-binding protein
MKLLRPGLLVLWGLAQVLPVFSENTVLRVGLSENKPPYTVASPLGGIEYDLVTQVVQGMGMTPEIQFLPNARAQALLRMGELDASISTTGEFLSLPFVAYENVAITLKRRNLSVVSVSGLEPYAVAAFQNAHLFLGPEFAKMAAANPGYRESAPQISLNRLLYTGRVDIIVSDWNIFNGLNSHVEESIDTTQPVKVHRLFPPTRYSLSFRNPSLRDAFNASLLKVLATDPYPALAAKYLPAGSEITFRP